MSAETIAGVGLLVVVLIVLVAACRVIYDLAQPPKTPPTACPAADYQKKCNINPEEASVDRWGASSWGTYEMTVECDRCGEKFHRFGLKKHELHDAGLDVDERL